MGTLRRNPDLKWRQTEADVAELHVKQLSILQSAARLVKPGGRLVYATCSLLREENEAVAEAFSAAQPGFLTQNVEVLLTALKLPIAHPSGHALTRDGHLRLWPHQHGTDGFFATVWQRAA
jgi:16S rRNA (cytosine967-C5)-methyltransferase